MKHISVKAKKINMINVACFHGQHFSCLTLNGIREAGSGLAEAFLHSLVITSSISLCFSIEFVSYFYQFGTQVKFRWSRDHNNRTAENAFSAP